MADIFFWRMIMKFLFVILSIVIFAVVSFGQEAQTTTVVGTEVAAKPEGTIRIGLVLPRLALCRKLRPPRLRTRCARL